MVSGTAADATQWIMESRLDDEAKAELLSFVRRFPGLPFLKRDLEELEQLEVRDGIALPSWLREMWCTLSFVDIPAQFRLGAYDGWTPREDREEAVWYTMAPGYSDIQERASLLRADIYPVALWIETAQSYLGVKLSGTSDVTIYEFAAEDIADDVRSGMEADSSVFPVFDTYSTVLSRILELQLPDGSLITAA